MATLVETIHAGGFIVSEANKTRSRDQITIKLGQGPMVPGTVLGRTFAAGSASETHAGNTGNGVMGAFTVGDGAIAGVYKLTVTKAAANAGDFEVVDPHGAVAGVGTVGVAFTGGGLSFTLADGAIDFVVGDKFTITVTLGAGKFVQLNTAGTDGSEVAAGVLFDAADATSADVVAAALVRACELNAAELTWPVGISAALKAAGIAALAANGVILR